MRVCTGEFSPKWDELSGYGEDSAKAELNRVFINISYYIAIVFCITWKVNPFKDDLPYAIPHRPSVTETHQSIQKNGSTENHKGFMSSGVQHFGGSYQKNNNTMMVRTLRQSVEEPSCDPRQADLVKFTEFVGSQGLYL